MHRDEMLSLFQQHRKAEAARDFDAIMATFVEDCYLETVARVFGTAGWRARAFTSISLAFASRVGSRSRNSRSLRGRARRLSGLAPTRDTRRWHPDPVRSQGPTGSQGIAQGRRHS